MKNIVIFGGAFDPIHDGHINMAINASKALNAEVFFVPAKVSVWKSAVNVSSEDKLNMIKLAIKDSGYKDKLNVSDYEINSEKEINYSIDTVKHFKEKYPDKELYFLIGSDHVNAFHKWRECDLIASLARIVFFSRPGYINDQDMVKRFNMLEIHGELKDISSTEIRNMHNLSVSKGVLDYIVDHKLYFAGKIKGYINKKRYLHSVSVARLAQEIAESNKIKDKERYFIAGLIHDVGKDIPIERQEAIVKEHYSEFISFPKVILHQFVGEYIAKTEFDIEDEEILEAIKYHTTGKRNLSKLSKCIYAADKIEPTRGFDSTEFINEMKVNIDNGFLAVLRANKDFFIERKIAFDNPLTAECFDYYLS